VVHTLLVIHFGLGCMHRRSAFKSDSPYVKGRSIPFSRDRFDQPQDGAARAAYGHLSTLIAQTQSDGFFSQCKTKNPELRQEDLPQSDQEARVRLARSQRSLYELRKLCDKATAGVWLFNTNVVAVDDLKKHIEAALDGG